MRILITGAAGRIGGQLIEELHLRNELVLLDRRQSVNRVVIRADLSRPHDRWPWRWGRYFADVDVVIHLVVHSRMDAPFRQLLRHNVETTWNVLLASEEHAVPRVVYASSNWVVRGAERALGPDCYSHGGPKVGAFDAPRPIGSYGVSKAAGEIAGKRFVDEKKIASFTAVRVGFCPLSGRPAGDETDHRWLGLRDLRSLFRRCVEAPIEGSHVVYGVSGQRTAPYDLSHTKELLSWAPEETA